MLHRITLLSAALVLALLALPLGVLPQEANLPTRPLETMLPETAEEGEPQDPEPEETGEAGGEPEEAQPEPEEEEGQQQAETADGEAPGQEERGQAQSQEEVPEEASEEEPQAGPTILRVLLPDGTVEEMELEEYLWGVLAAEMPVTFRGEALKAQAVAARTYTLYQISHTKKAHPEADVCTDYSCCQAWISREDRLDQWPEEERESYAGRISAALRLTEGQILTWEGEPILAVFHASSAGWTRSAQEVWGTEVPYLTAVESPEGEGDSPNYYSVVTLSQEEFAQKFQEAYPQADLTGALETWFSSPETDESGAPTAFTVGGVRVTAQELRTLCGLRSATFQVECQEGAISFYVTGYGHGVGMSQYGANVLANQGLTWQEILAHYYPGTQLAPLDTP